MKEMFECYLKRKLWERREDLDRRISLRIPSIVVPEAILLEENISYSDALCYDMFLPRDNSRKYPAIIDVHGGGLFMGRKEQNRSFCLQLAAEGYLVCAMDYSLVPEKNVFEILEEVRASFEAIYARLSSLDCFNGEVFAIGDSAGAYLLLETLAIKGNADFSAVMGVDPISFPIKAVVFQNGMFYTAKRDRMRFLSPFFYGKDFRKKDFYPYLDPNRRDLIETLPPFFFFTTTRDYLRSYSVDYAKAVTAIRSDVEFHDYDYLTMEHAYACLYPEMEECRLVNSDMLAFLKSHQSA